MRVRSLAVLVLLAALSPVRAETITIAIVPSVPAGSTLIAERKGYFRDAGLDVTIERIDSMGKAVAFLAVNHVQVAQGGINAGIFNAIAQGLPVTLALDGGSTPLYHRLLVRRDLADKIKSVADLKGRSVGLSAPGSTSMYEMAMTLATAGLTLRDVEVKNLAFAQMPASPTSSIPTGRRRTRMRRASSCSRSRAAAVTTARPITAVPIAARCSTS